MNPLMNIVCINEHRVYVLLLTEGSNHRSPGKAWGLILRRILQAPPQPLPSKLQLQKEHLLYV
jgi:hypothetical protein